MLFSSPGCFNPRTHEECDKLPVPTASLFDVSIHALTRSATRLRTLFRSVHLLFQYTHSRGVRLISQFITQGTKSFNPRTHEECDIGGDTLQLFLVVSIHALTRSATLRNPPQKLVRPVSIHALTRSATTIVITGKYKAYVSIHALTRSAT